MGGVWGGLGWVSLQGRTIYAFICEAERPALNGLGMIPANIREGAVKGFDSPSVGHIF